MKSWCTFVLARECTFVLARECTFVLSRECIFVLFCNSLIYIMILLSLTIILLKVEMAH